METEEKTNKKVIRVAIFTQYLTESLENFGKAAECFVNRKTGENITPEEYVEKQTEEFGYNPNNFSGVKKLITPKGKTVFLETTEDHILSDPRLADLAVAGSTEGFEHVVTCHLKGSGLIVARYSTFYGGKSRYSGNSAAKGGYSLDIPKKVETVRTFLTDDRTLDALLERDEKRILTALGKLNKKLAEPILITDYLTQVLKDGRRNRNGK